MSKILIDESTVKLALEALDHCKDVIVERGLNGNPEFAKRWGLTLPLQRSEEAITALREALAEQPAQQEPVAEVKAKTTGGNVGIATVIHEIYSPLREPLQPGDKLYAAHRWMGWDVEQVWSERIFGIDMRFENVQDAIAFRKKLEEAAHGITKGNT